MVAAAGERGAISPSKARLLLLGLAVARSRWRSFSRRVPTSPSFVGVEKSPEILRERAREILRGRRHRQSPRIGRTGSKPTTASSSGLAITAESAATFRAMPWPSRIDSRASSLVPALAVTGPFPSPWVTSVESRSRPPRNGRGLGRSARAARSARGRSSRASGRAAAAAAPTDWSLLFREAGLDMSRFAPVEPRWSPARLRDRARRLGGAAPRKARRDDAHRGRLLCGTSRQLPLDRPLDAAPARARGQPGFGLKARSSSRHPVPVPARRSAARAPQRACGAQRPARSGAPRRRGRRPDAASCGSSAGTTSAIPTRAGCSSRRSATPPERGSSTGSSTSRSSPSRAAAGPRC